MNMRYEEFVKLRMQGVLLWDVACLISPGFREPKREIAVLPKVMIR